MITPEQVLIEPPKLTRNETLKANIPTLAGHIAATVADANAACFSADDEQFLKFHGIYQQDDRDLRKTGKKYMMMIRGRIPGGGMTPARGKSVWMMLRGVRPGGVVAPAQWMTFDDLASNYGNTPPRIPPRQSIQFHG